MKKTVIVAGMGPAGLVSAIEALKKGYRVLLMDPRGEPFTRTQRMKINQYTYKYLKEFIDPNDAQDVDFLNRIAEDEHNNAVPMDELQKYLYKKLLKMLEDPKNSADIRMGEGNEVLDFDFRDKDHNMARVSYKENKENDKEKVLVRETKVEFEYFVAADGAKHRMADKLNEAFLKNEQKEKEIVYKNLELQTRQAPHGTVCLRAKPPFTTVPFRTPGLVMGESQIKELRVLGWDEPFAPKCYMFYNLEKNRMFVAGEIPQSILDITKRRLGESEKEALEQLPERRRTQQDMMVKWGKLIMKCQYGVRQPNKLLEFDAVSEKKKNAEKMNILRATAFEVSLQYTDTPCVNLNKNAFFVSVGDAALNANFNIGHGANDAISDGQIFGQCLPDEGDERFLFGQRAFMDLRDQKKKWLQDQMERRELEERGEYQSLCGIYSRKLREALVGPNNPEAKQGVEGVNTTKDVNYGRYLIKLASPLESYDDKLKIEREKFEKFLKLVTEKPENVVPDQYYQSVLSFSKAINDAIDKQIEAEPAKLTQEIGKMEEERKKIADDLYRINLGRLEAFRSFAIIRSASWAAKRAELESELGSITQKEEAYKKQLEGITEPAFLKKMAELKDKTPGLMVKDSSIIHGFHTLKDKLKKPAPTLKEEKVEEIIPAPAPIIFDAPKMKKGEEEESLSKQIEKKGGRTDNSTDNMREIKDSKEHPPSL